MQELEDSVAHPNCDPNNGLGMDTARFDEAINAACKDHDELRRRKRHGAGLIKRGTFTYENTDKDNLHWKLRWEDEGGQCALRCDDVFNQMLHYDKCMSCPGNLPLKAILILHRQMVGRRGQEGLCANGMWASFI